MARYKKGDQVRVNGQDAIILSWPASDSGAFAVATRDRKGGEVRSTLWTSNSLIEAGDDKEPAHQILLPDQISMIKQAPPPPPSRPVPAAIITEAHTELQAIKDAQRAKLKAELLAEIDAEQGVRFGTMPTREQLREEVRAELLAEAARALPVQLEADTSEPLAADDETPDPFAPGGEPQYLESAPEPDPFAGVSPVDPWSRGAGRGVSDE